MEHPTEAAVGVGAFAALMGVKALSRFRAKVIEYPERKQENRELRDISC